MTRGATVRVTRAKTDQKTAQNNEDEPPQCGDTFEVKNIRWQQTRKLVDALRFKFSLRFGGDFNRFGIGQQLCADKTADENTRYEKEIPCFFFPIVFEKRDIRRDAYRANVLQTRRNPERFVAQ